MGWRGRLKEQAHRARHAPARDAPRPSDGTRPAPKVLTGAAINAETAVMLEHVGAVHQNTRDQLAILRQTRGQRQVGALKIPAHLQAPLSITLGGTMGDDTGVEERGALASVLPSRE